MKLLLDQGLPRSALRHLADMEIAAEHVGDLGMATATDAQRRIAVGCVKRTSTSAIILNS